MKIFCLIDSLGSGGAQRQLVGLAQYLRQAGHDASVLYYHDDHFYRPFCEKHEIPTQCFYKHPRKIRNLAALLTYIRHNKPDAIISYLGGPNMLNCLLRLFRYRYRCIVSERTSTRALPPSAKQKLRFFLYRQADFVVPNSFAEAEYLSKKYPRLSRKIHPITNFVDLDYFCPAIPRESSMKALRIVGVGRINRAKNIHRLLRAIHRIPADKPFRIDWFGRIEDESYYRECQQTIRDLQLEERFYFHDATSQILTVYRQADALCLPSVREGFPNVICEAMACGLPILCSHVGDNPRIVADTSSGWIFDPYAVDSISEALRSFLRTTPDQREEIARKNRDNALKQFSSRTFTEQYLHLLDAHAQTS